MMPVCNTEPSRNDTSPNCPERPGSGTTMDPMPTQPAHAKPARRDHVWVLAVVAGFALFDVWESWTQVGDKSGFAHGTGWTLTVIVEAYAGYALFAWFDAPGRRSRRFAMWSAFTVLGFSLIGQGSSSVAAHSVPPLAVAVFVKDLPVIVLALIAILIHLRRLDRAAITEAEQESAVVRELAAVRAELEAERGALQPLRDALAGAQEETTQASAKVDELTRKLAVATARKRRTATARKPARATGRKSESVTGSATAPEADAITAPDEAPADLDSEAKVLWYLDKGYSASKAGTLSGLTDSRGRQIARLAAAAPKGQDAAERSDERS